MIGHLASALGGRVLPAAVALTLALTACAHAQTGPPPEFAANGVLPRPLPNAPMSDWVNAKGRTTTTLNAPGAVLHGWTYAGANPKAPTLVFFLPNGTTLDANDAICRSLAKLGPSVVAYDYRGFGFSIGVADIHSMQTDAVLIVSDVSKSAGSRGVIVYGFSLGTAMAAFAASQVPVNGVILADPFASAAEALPIALKHAGATADVVASTKPADDAVAAFGNVDFVGRIQAPLLIIHGAADADIPIAQGREVYAASTSQRKEFVELPDIAHDGVLAAPATAAAIKTFVTSLTP
jgi:pimeloyl-ACP methyl ester carboxylesterase